MPLRNAAFTIEVNMSKGWEIVYETNNQANALARLSKEMSESCSGDFYEVRLTVDWNNQPQRYDNV